MPIIKYWLHYQTLKIENMKKYSMVYSAIFSSKVLKEILIRCLIDSLIVLLILLLLNHNCIDVSCFYKIPLTSILVKLFLQIPLFKPRV